MSQNGRLYICGTPIGNLKDITFRAVEILKDVDLIAAEDTRKTAKLLQHYEIKTKLISYYQHNEKKRARQLLNKIKKGYKLALVSNAGMPGISDPGAEIISLARQNNIEIIPVPGPTALVSALVVSDRNMDRFVFEGFLPRSGQERKERLREIKKEKRTIVIYESPYRLRQTLQDLSSKLENRKLTLVRELTKVHEEKIYGSCSEVLEQLAGREIKGEIVLVISGRPKKEIEKAGWEEYEIVDHVRLLMKEGYTKKEAIKQVARERSLSRNEVYEEAIAINVDPDQYI